MKKRRAKGNGHLISNPDGTKTLIKSFKNAITGKTQKVQVTAPTEAACIKRMNARRSEIELLQSTVNINMTTAQLCQRHLEMQYSHGLIKRTSRDRNEVTIKNQIEKYPIGHMQAHSVTSKDIDEHFDMLIRKAGLSASSLEKVKYILDGSFKWAVGRGDIYKNPVDGIRDRLSRDLATLKKKGANDADVRILTTEEENRIMAETLKKSTRGGYKYPGGLHFRFLLYTGLRVGEYISLKWEDYDSKNHILSITKTAHSRYHRLRHFCI